MKMSDGSITTYDSFPSLRETLKSLEDRVLPPVVSTLTLALNEPERYVALRKVARASAGRTAGGVTVHDIRLDMRADLTVSRSISDTRAVEILDVSVSRAPRLHQRSARYFALGTAEDDQLKKFLFFFLSLEVETHAAFVGIDHAHKLRRHILRDGTRAPRQSTVELITRDVSKWNNLFDRFVWCATSVWSGLADDDITLFKNLKGIRDAIAHGQSSEPPAESARQAELLAHKVLWGQAD